MNCELDIENNHFSFGLEEAKLLLSILNTLESHITSKNLQHKTFDVLSHVTSMINNQITEHESKLKKMSISADMFSNIKDSMKKKLESRLKDNCSLTYFSSIFDEIFQTTFDESTVTSLLKKEVKVKIIKKEKTITFDFPQFDENEDIVVSFKKK
jgi:hypothetical protein